MNIILREADKRRLQDWDSFVDEANGGTLFHRRDFLAYHGDRFSGRERWLVFLKGESIYGVMPIVMENNERGRAARSPYGASLGGPIFREPLTYGASHRVVDALFGWAEEEALSQITLTQPPPFCRKQPSQTLELAMMERGFLSKNRDISSVVDIQADDPMVQASAERRNNVRRAEKNGVKVVFNAPTEEFWSLLDHTYKQHGTTPTHTRDEFEWLREHLSGRICVHTAEHRGVSIAGVCCFAINDRVNSSFYLAKDSSATHLQPLSLLVMRVLEDSRGKGYQYFDFGTSSVGMVGRPNVFAFKEQFGALGYFRETFVWSSQ